MAVRRTFLSRHPSHAVAFALRATLVRFGSSAAQVHALFPL